MRHIGSILAAAALAFASGRAASAGVLNSPFVYPRGTEALFCSAVNVATTSIATVTIDLVDHLGGIVATNTCPAVAANSGCSIFSPSAANARCRITFSGPKTKIRGLMELDDASGDTKVAIPLY